MIARAKQILRRSSDSGGEGEPPVSAAAAGKSEAGMAKKVAKKVSFSISSNDAPLEELDLD